MRDRVARTTTHRRSPATVTDDADAPEGRWSSADLGSQRPEQQGGGMVDKLKERIA